MEPDYRIDDFLHMLWLRPENVVWDAVAAHLIGTELLGAPGREVMELGIGNGYFTYMALGGRFRKDYDWYFNVNTESNTDNRDIYDHLSVSNISEYLLSPPRRRIRLGIDHKVNLLKQAEQLGFVDELRLADANNPISSNEIQIVYSNIIYWLRDPLETVRRLAQALPSGGRLVLVFPNQRFYEYCRSYTEKGPLWKKLNRGRADNILWHMDAGQFVAFAGKMGLEPVIVRSYLSKLTLTAWDIGMRPLSPHLIKMANNLSPAARLEMKAEWCATLKPFADALLEDELQNGPDMGGFNFVVLAKR